MSTAAALWGCHNRIPINGLMEVRDGYHPTGVPRFRLIPTPWTDRCDHGPNHPSDARCAGCRHHPTGAAHA